MPKPITEGIILYTLEYNSCLNAVYTNEHEDGVIYNEIARPRQTHKDIIGKYDCFYFDNGNQRVDAELTITLASDINGLKKKFTKSYLFEWRVNNTIIFTGIGYKINNQTIAVHYKSTIK